GQIDLLLQGVSPVIVFRTGELLLELVDSILVGLYRRFALIGLGIEFLALGRRRSRMFGGLAHLVTESDVHRMVGQFECLAGKSLLIPVVGQGSHRAGRLQRLLIYDWKPAAR